MERQDNPKSFIAGLLFSLIICAIVIINGDYSLALSLLFFGMFIISMVIDIKKGIILFIVYSYFIPFMGMLIDYAQGKVVSRDYLSALPDLLLVVFVIVFCFYLVIKKDRIINDNLDKWVILYIAVSIFYIFINSSGVVFGLYGARLGLFPMIMYFIARNFFKKIKDIEYLLNLLMILSIMDILFGLYQYTFGVPSMMTNRPGWETDWESFASGVVSEFGPRMEGFEKLFSFSGGSYHLFYPLAFFAIILLNIKNEFMGKEFRVLKSMFLGLFLILLSLGTERTPIVMVFAGFAFSLLDLSSKAKFRESLRKCLAFSGAVFIFIAALSTVLSSSQSARWYRLSELANPLQAETLGSRIEVPWQEAMEYIKANPVFGLGLGTGSSLNIREDVRKGAPLVAPHNMFLLIGMETGVFGLIIFILLIINIVIAIVKKQRYLYNTMSEGLLKGIFGGVVAVLISGIANIPLEYHLGIFFWFFIGLIPLLPKIEYQNAKGIL